MRLGGLKRVIRESTYVKKRPLMSILLNEAEYNNEADYIRYAQTTLRDWVNQTLNGYELNAVNTARKDQLLKRIDDTRDPTELAKEDFRLHIQTGVNEILQSLDQQMTHHDGTPGNSDFKEKLDLLSKYESFIKSNTNDNRMFDDLRVIADHGYTYRNFSRVKNNLNRLKGLMDDVRLLIESKIIEPNKEKIISTCNELLSAIEWKEDGLNQEQLSEARWIKDSVNTIIGQVRSENYDISKTERQLNDHIDRINAYPEPQAEPENPIQQSNTDDDSPTASPQEQPGTLIQQPNSDSNDRPAVSPQELQRAINAIKEFEFEITKYLAYKPEDEEATKRDRDRIDEEFEQFKSGKKDLSFLLAYVDQLTETYRNRIKDEEEKLAIRLTPSRVKPSTDILDDLRRTNQDYVDVLNSTPDLINMIEKDHHKIYLNVIKSKTSIEDNYTGLKTQYYRLSNAIKRKITLMLEIEEIADSLRTFYFDLLNGFESEFIIKIETSLSELESSEASIPPKDRVIKPQTLSQVQAKYNEIKNSRSGKAEDLRLNVDKLMKLSVDLSDMIKQQETEMRKRQGKTVKTQQGSLANPDYNNYEDFQKAKVKQGQEAEYKELQSKTGLSKIWGYAKYAVNKGRDFVAGLLGKLNTWMKKIQQRILEKGSSGFLTTIQKNLARVIDFLSRNLHNMITKYRDKIDSKVYYINNGKLMVEESARPLRRYGFLESNNFEQIGSRIYDDEIILYEQVDMIMEEMLYDD